MLDTDIRYARAPRIIERQVDSEMFLIDDDHGSIHSLDAVAAGIWRLLEEPHGEHEIVAIFKAAFPQRNAKDLRRLVRRLLSELERSDLAVRETTGPSG
jgi:hypothetical protein